jgi:hypothetical protein
MKRENLFAGSLLGVGLLFTVGAVVTKYAPLFDPGPRADVSHLIELALGDAEPPIPHGDSVLSHEGVKVTSASTDSATEVPDLAGRMFAGPWVTPGDGVEPGQPTRWAAEAAARDPGALRAWLGWTVLPIATTDGDTVRLRMYRPRLHRGCPVIERIEASLTRPRGAWETGLVRIEGGCWE